MAGLKGGTFGPQQNNGISLTLNTQTVENQLRKLRDTIGLSVDKFNELNLTWRQLVDHVKSGAADQDTVFAQMGMLLEGYNIKVNNLTQAQIDKQKELIEAYHQQGKIVQEVETKTVESSKKKVDEEEKYRKKISEVNKLLEDRALFLSGFSDNKFVLGGMTANETDNLLRLVSNNLARKGRNDSASTKILKNLIFDSDDIKSGKIDISNPNSIYSYLKDQVNLRYHNGIEFLTMAMLNDREGFNNYLKENPVMDSALASQAYDLLNIRGWNQKGSSTTFKDNYKIESMLNKWNFITGMESNRSEYYPINPNGATNPVRINDLAKTEEAIKYKNAFEKALGVLNPYYEYNGMDSVTRDRMRRYYKNQGYWASHSAKNEEFWALHNAMRDRMGMLGSQIDFDMSIYGGMDSATRDRMRKFYKAQEFLSRYPQGSSPAGIRLVEEKGDQDFIKYLRENNIAIRKDNIDSNFEAFTEYRTPAIDKSLAESSTLRNMFNNTVKGITEMASGVSATFDKLGREVGMSLREMGNSIRTMASVIYSAIHLVRALNSVMNVSDSITSVSYRLDRYDTTGASRKTLLNNAFAGANRARADVDSFATLAQRILATNVTNGNASESMRLAELIIKSMVLGGSTAQEQHSATLQLSQALASNQLGGDELRAIRENAVGFTDILSKGLSKGYEKGIFTNPEFQNAQIGTLKQLGKKGLLTADVVTKAVGLMEDEINKDFSQMPELFSHTINKLMNTFKKRLNEFNQEGKGLTRIVNIFQDLDKWLDSDKGKKALDKMLDILDTFIEMIMNIVSKISGFLDFISPVLPGLAKIASVAIPMNVFNKLLLGSTDLRGNQRAGLVGYGGITGVLSNLAKGANIISSLFQAEVVNGRNVIVGGLVPTIFAGFAKWINPNFASRVYARNALSIFENASSPLNASKTLRQLVSLGANEDRMKGVLKQLGANINKHGNISGFVDGFDLAFNLNKEGVDKVFNIGEATKEGVKKGLFSTVLTKAGLSSTVVLPILGSLAAIAALIAGAKAYQHFDKKKENEDFEAFINGLPDLSPYKYLAEEDTKYLKDEYAPKWFNENYDRTGFGGKKKWTETDRAKFSGDYISEAVRLNDERLKAIEENTEQTASNTQGTLQITEEFIRNMKDIRTRSFRQDIFTNAHGTQHSWTVTVNNQSDVSNIVEQIANAVDKATNANMGIGG